MFGGVVHQTSLATVTSDASGSWGCSAFSNMGACSNFSGLCPGQTSVLYAGTSGKESQCTAYAIIQ